MDLREILNNKAKCYGYRSWFSKETMLNSIHPLKNEKMLAAFEDAIIEAEKIDCIWFDGKKKIPAFFKISNVNIVEGICRLNNLKELIPPYYSRYFLVVEDAQYQDALFELSMPTFRKSGIEVIKKSELADMCLN